MTTIIIILISALTYGTPTAPKYPQGDKVDHGVIA